MKLVRFGPPGREKPGIIDKDGHIRNLSKVVPDISGATLSAAGLAKIKKAKIEKLPKVPGKPRLGPCVGNVRHFIAIGLNYTDHAAEVGMPLPKEPIIFAKAPNSICGPNDNVIQPKGSIKLDYEVELCIVIGKRAQYIKSQKDAKNFIAGYCICNDVSERSFQIDRGGSQWDKGKGAENFGPVGPWLVTRDEVKNVQNLKMWTNVNGEKRQHGSTKTMIFGAEYLVWYCSQFYVLEPGDLITTGTPPGVAQGMKPPKFLKPGDVVTMGIEGLGEQRQKIVKAK
ncbi:MAG TPA: fumarylacetoacetate hydrolase family protein [Xanthobacteraceae bacterium]|jgi:2-keto-4-pentenoate hydratase/2-oxohepta-3-ene-1,7-dioic acid hydratase in catechol pathway|nr:fumarylacetoacetate hydrolase family protein [Xanthobacteraceae bacterium]